MQVQKEFGNQKKNVEVKAEEKEQVSSTMISTDLGIY